MSALRVDASPGLLCELPASCTGCMCRQHVCDFFQSDVKFLQFRKQLRDVIASQHIYTCSGQNSEYSHNCYLRTACSGYINILKYCYDGVSGLRTGVLRCLDASGLVS